jgi:hypothetical protein
VIRLDLPLLRVRILVRDGHRCSPLHYIDLRLLRFVQLVGRGKTLGRQGLVGGRRRQDSRQVVEVALDHALLRGESLVQTSESGLGDLPLHRSQCHPRVCRQRRGTRTSIVDIGQTRTLVSVPESRREAIEREGHSVV